MTYPRMLNRQALGLTVHRQIRNLLKRMVPSDQVTHSDVMWSLTVLMTTSA